MDIREVQSQDKPNEVEYLQGKKLINIDVEEVLIEEGTAYKYTQLVCEVDEESALLDYRLDNALALRVESVYKDIEYKGVMYQVGEGKDGQTGINNFLTVVNNVLITGDTTATVDWIASDNSIQVLDYEDIKNIIIAYNERKQKIFTAYGIWRSGDMLEDFEV